MIYYCVSRQWGHTFGAYWGKLSALSGEAPGWSGVEGVGKPFLIFN